MEGSSPTAKALLCVPLWGLSQHIDAFFAPGLTRP